MVAAKAKGNPIETSGGFYLVVCFRPGAVSGICPNEEGRCPDLGGALLFEGVANKISAQVQNANALDADGIFKTGKRCQWWVGILD